MDMVLSVLNRALIASTPLLIATLGEIISERGGILNLGVEGMMAIGAVTGFIVTFNTGHPGLGMLAAVVAGAGLSLIHAFISISLQASQVVSGLALTMLGLGISGFWGKPFIGKPLAEKIEGIHIPVLGDIPVIGKLLFQQDVYFYLAIALGVGSWFFLSRTRPGIALRSVGENPKAAESQGVNVSAYRYWAVIAGGAMAGLAGSHLSLSYSRSWIEGMTAGRGWIVIALTIFSIWSPLRAFWSAFLFGGIFVLQYMLQPLGISPNLLAALPYATTLIVLMIFGMNKDSHRKMHAPAMLGEVYRRGER